MKDNTMIIALGGKIPQIGQNVFIAPTAVIVGDVQIEDGASIWYGAVLRGDMARIRVGKNTNIQDNCTIHTDFGKPATIGSHVTIGHNVILHGCTVEDHCLIGMGCILLNEAHIHTGSLVGAGSLIKERQVVGPYQLVAGSPAIFRKKLSPEDIARRIAAPIQNYLDAAVEHMRLTVLQ
jgi:carbonic anhydrase/acetyltransferase-like protein (isoleucine patch superfamily)